MEKVPFILSDESVNSYGYRVLTSGIKLERFLKNPVMFYCHLRAEKDSNSPILPIGRWENLRKVKSELLGDAVFDMDDPFARSVANKVSKGILNAASININLIDLSESPDLQHIDQKLPTVTVSELMEVSIADIPGNKNAVKLFSHSKPIDPNDLKLTLSNSLTEYERLWRTNIRVNGRETSELAVLKEGNPSKFAVLQSEYLTKIRQGKR